ncbi:MAG TPA: phage holin family protein [Syntrophorhabdaceae bacterium]|nr:phage holin family protein [Syntrophorhabdaceae bacterium]
MSLILKWFLMTISVGVAAHLIPGVSVAGFMAALWVALFLGIVNVLIRPILILVTLPINILTLGLFTFVINACLVLLASVVIKGFEVKGFSTAVLFSIVLSVINYLLNALIRAGSRNEK